MKKIQKFWDALPKDIKVLSYMVGAGLLDSLVMRLKPELIYWVPVTYRVLVWNLVEVFVIERLKGLSELLKKKK